MKIAIISPHFYPYVEFGGPVNSLWGLCKSLSKFFSIHVYTIKNGPNVFFNKLNSKKIKIHKNLKCFYYDEQIKNFFSFDFFFKIFKNIKQNDLIFIQYVFSYMSIISLLISVFLKKKIIISPRGSISKYGIFSKRTTLKRICLFLIYIPFQKKIIWHATSINEKNDIMSFFTRSKVKIMFDGIDNSYLSFNSTTKRNNFFKNFSIPYRKFDRVFCSLGRLHKVKRFDLLIDSFEEYLKKNERSILIIGGSDFGEKRYLLDKINNKNKIFLIGHLDENEKKNLLKNSDFFILTSDYESFSVSTVEALALGVPVIISKNLPWKDVAAKKCGILVDNNINSILDALIKSNSSKFKSLDCKNYVKSKFLWSVVTNTFIDKFIKER